MAGCGCCGRTDACRRCGWTRPLRGCVAGFTHGEGPRLLDRLDSGDALHLVREQDNQHDPLAVRIDWNGGHKLGYVARAENAPIARRLDAGAALGAVLIAVRRENPAWPQVEFAVTQENGEIVRGHEQP